MITTIELANGITMGLYLQDYGRPVGNRIIGRHPEWLEWLVIQNANAYEEGFTAAWDAIRHALWAHRGPETEASLEAFLELLGVKLVYTPGHRNTDAISPDNWKLDRYFLSRPNAHRVQLDLFYDYRTKVALYPRWQACQRERQPRTLIPWGQNEIFFTPQGGDAYLRDLSTAKLIKLDSGHFVVEDSFEIVADATRRFYEERLAAPATAG